ncbi:MAG: PqqD family protein [Opitutales bacterium]|nr:PqqD family protein [Opitutales bacterium]
MSNHFLLDQTIVRNSELSFTEIDGETVVMNVETGNYYGIDEVGSRIWELLKEPLSIKDLCVSLTEEYDADLETIQGDLLPYLQELITENLIKEV